MTSEPSCGIVSSSGTEKFAGPGNARRGVRGSVPFGAGIAVERGADTAGPTEFGDQRFHAVRRQLLAMLGAGGTGDRLVHQGAAEIVGAGIETILGALDAHLHPRGLDVPDVRVERQPADRVHQHGFAESRAHAGLALQRDRRLAGRIHLGQQQHVGAAVQHHAF